MTPKGEKLSKMFKLSEEELRARLPPEVTIDYAEYRSHSSLSKFTFTDKDYGKFTAWLGNVMRGHGHRKRGALKQAASTRLSLEEVTQRLPAHTTIVWSSYKGMRKKCWFVDSEFGQFFSVPMTVLNGTQHPSRKRAKIVETTAKRYGVTHNMKHRDLALANARSRASSYETTHWKTGQRLVCNGSWELLTVLWLNKNESEYEWQPGPFTLPDGRAYTPDIYFPSSGVYVDIKGYENEYAVEKMKLISETIKNLVVWRRNDLVDRGILSSQHRDLAIAKPFKIRK